MGGFKNCSWVQANNGGDEDPIALQRDVIGINISSVVKFQRWWVLKSKLFGQESTCHQGKIFKKNPSSNDSLSKSAKIVLSKSILDVKNY